jgi:prepilin-type N-terminal cleavage/methylation domain-containing protein
MPSINHCRSRGVTLLELLVVLMILSIVLTAAVKTWDVTLERGRAQTTASKLTQLVKVIIGDPDYIVTGQRADFGFVGDMGRVPNSLSELVVAPSGSTTWRGPYIRSTFSQSVDGFRIDGWGDTIIYGRELYNSRDSLFVRSYGGRGVADRTRWQTLNFPYSDTALTQNQVIGQVFDMKGSLPVTNDQWRFLNVRLYYPNDGKLDSADQTGLQMQANPPPYRNYFRYLGIPQGTHRLVATYWEDPAGTKIDTTTELVPVYPGVGEHHVILRLPVDWNQ